MRVLACFFAFAFAAYPVQFIDGPYWWNDSDTLHGYWRLDVAGSRSVSCVPQGGGTTITATVAERRTVNHMMLMTAEAGKTYDCTVTVEAADLSTAASPAVTVTIPALASIQTAVLPPATAWSTGIHTVPAAGGAVEISLTGSYSNTNPGPGHVFTVGANCLTAESKSLRDITEALRYLDSDNTGNVYVNVDPGCTYEGKLYWRKRTTHDSIGSVIVRNISPTMPPDGVRMTGQWTARPRFVNTSLWGFGTTGQTAGTTETGCSTGEYKWNNTTSKLYYCQSLNTFVEVTQTPGADPPTPPCTVNPLEVYVQTNAPPLQGVFSGVGKAGVWLCVATNTWKKFDIYNNSGVEQSAMWQFEPGAKGYRFVGLEFKCQDRYSGANVSTAQMTGKYFNQCRTFAAAGSGALVEDITFDRIYVDPGNSDEMRVEYFSVMSGKNVALINSAVLNWRWGTTNVSAASTANTVYHSSYVMYLVDGTGPYLFENNHIENAGITFYADQGTTGSSPDNGVIRRNTVIKPLRTIMGHPQKGTDPWYYHNRHAFELKRGKLWSVTGNRLYYNYAGDSDRNQGQWFMLTPVNLTNPSLWTITDATDCTITVTGGSLPWTVGRVRAVETGRVRISITGTSLHNGFWTPSSITTAGVVNLGTCGITGTSTLSGTPQLNFIIMGLETSDITFQHNYAYGGAGAVALSYSHGDVTGAGNWLTKRIKFDNNIFENLSMELADSGGWAAVGSGYPYGARNQWTSLQHTFGLFGGAQNHAESGGSTLDVSITRNVAINGAVRTDMTINTFIQQNTVMNEHTVSKRNNWSKNVFYSARTTNAIVSSDTNSVFGDAGVAKLWHTPSLIFKDNAFCCSNSATHPSDWNNGTSSTAGALTYPALATDLGWFSQTRSNYRLKSYLGASLNNYFTAGYGPDVDAMEAEQGLVKNVRVRRLNEAAPVLSYYKPDNQACTVEYGPSATIGHASNTRTTDAGSSRLGSVTMTNAGSAGTYYWWLLCAVPPDALGNAHASGSFVK